MSTRGKHPSITVSELLEQAPARLELEVVAGGRGAGERTLTVPRIQKLGLALAGFTHYLDAGRVQIVGQSEIWFLGQLTPERRREAIGNLSLEKIACVLVTKGLPPPVELVEAAEETGLPLIQTPLVSSLAVSLVTEFLQSALAPRELRHGVLMDLYGLGVLIEGKSGVGKSECALDLIVRGHRLIADDMVEVRRTGPEQIIGSAPELLREHMEIRGLGILNVRELFGVSSVSGPKQIGLNIRLERWGEAREVERLGLDEQQVEILGVGVPHFLLPVSPGRNLSTLVETAVRVHLSRVRGYNAAQNFVARHAALVYPATDDVGAARFSNTTAKRDDEAADEREKKSG